MLEVQNMQGLGSNVCPQVSSAGIANKEGDIMKNELLKFSVITLALSCSAAYASDDANVIPTQQSGFALSITGLYLQPSASNLQYAIYTTPLPLPSPNWYQQTIAPNYSGAFDLGLQYNLMNGKENVKFDWLHLRSSDSDGANSSGHTSVGPIYYFGPTEQFLLNTGANSTVIFNVDNGNLVFGHLVNLTNNIQLEPFMGLSVAYLKQDINDNYWGTDPVYGPYTHNVETKSSFTGFGPRLGLDGSYFITNHFAVTESIASDLLVGSLNYSTNFISWTGYTGGSAAHNNTPTRTSMANQVLHRFVPEVDAKVAMLYKVPMKSSELTMQAGYMFADYINAINQVLPSTLVAGSWEAGSVAIVTQSQQQSSLALDGPFVSLSWKF